MFVTVHSQHECGVHRLGASPKAGAKSAGRLANSHTTCGFCGLVGHTRGQARCALGVFFQGQATVVNVDNAVALFGSIKVCVREPVTVAAIHCGRRERACCQAAVAPPEALVMGQLPKKSVYAVARGSCELGPLAVRAVLLDVYAKGQQEVTDSLWVAEATAQQWCKQGKATTKWLFVAK